MFEHQFFGSQCTFTGGGGARRNSRRVNVFIHFSSTENNGGFYSHSR